jgi:hypothetical protein
MEAETQVKAVIKKKISETYADFLNDSSEAKFRKYSDSKIEFMQAACRGNKFTNFSPLQMYSIK